jgi:uncharacterized integral membrane protein
MLKDTLKKPKVIVIIVLVVLAFILIVQNAAAVETHFLLWSFAMSRALLLILTFLFGFVVGMITTSILLAKKSKASQQSQS